MFAQAFHRWFPAKPVTQAVENPSVIVVYFNKLHVGTLTRNGQLWHFKYSEEFKAQSDIAPITDFPDKQREYKSFQLWPFFALRIPGPNQPDVREFIASTQPTEEILLGRFGRRSASNPFTLAHAD